MKQVGSTNIGIRLKYLRKEKRLTQKEFAKIGNVSVQSQRFYETGERSANTEYLQNLVTHNINVCYLFSDVDQSIEEITKNETRINQEILTEILEAMDNAIAEKNKDISNKVKADLVSLFYVSFNELGKVNADLIKGHLNHVS